MELFTDEMQKDYLEWCKTEEGKSYLVGGSNYREGGLELSGKGTPIEFANAVINLFLGDVNDLELADLRKRELGEIAEHIQVFLKYSERNY